MQTAQDATNVLPLETSLASPQTISHRQQSCGLTRRRRNEAKVQISVPPPRSSPVDSRNEVAMPLKRACTGTGRLRAGWIIGLQLMHIELVRCRLMIRTLLWVFFSLPILPLMQTVCNFEPGTCETFPSAGSDVFVANVRIPFQSQLILRRLGLD
jgi:hypothetical protein